MGRKQTLTIEVFGGLVSDVKGLPPGTKYKIVDLDENTTEIFIADAKGDRRLSSRKISGRAPTA